MANKSSPGGSQARTAGPLDTGKGVDSVDTFQKAVNRFIDDFFTSFDLLPLSVFEDAGLLLPKVSITRDQKALTITLDLPGMEAGDIEVTLGPDTLMIEGRKRGMPGMSASSIQDEFHARSYRKMIPIPFGIDARNARATFSNRVLTITLPRLAGDFPARVRIPIKS